MNGGTLNTTGNYGTSGSLITTSSTGTSTKFLRGFYGSKVGSVNTTTFATNTSSGLHDYNSPSGINIEKTGYAAVPGAQWNTKADGTGTSYNHATTTYDANGFGGANLATGNRTVTLYVNWEPVNYSITYELDGGTNASGNPTSYNIESPNITLEDATKPGYEFLGWVGEGVTTPTKNLVIPTGSTGNRTYTAYFSTNKYSIIYDGNGATGGSTATQNNIEYDHNVTLNSNGFAKQYTVTYNYNEATGGNTKASDTSAATFLGWTVGGPNLLSYYDLTNKLNMTVNGDGTLSYDYDNTSGSSEEYANFSFKKNDVLKTNTRYVYIANIKEINAPSSGAGNMHISQENRATQVSTSSSSIAVNNLTVGLNYLNTTTISDFSSATTSIRGFVSIPAGKHTSMRFRPILIENTYNDVDLYYNNGATTKNLAESGTVTLYADWTDMPGITLPTPTKTGYTFGGWYTDSGLTNPVTLTSGKYVPTATGILYAKWNPISYTIKFNANGGTGNMSNLTMTYGVAKNLTKNTFNKTGYSFNGWNTQTDGTGTSYSDEQSVNNLTTVSGDTVNLYAQWTANKYKITLNNQGATSAGTTAVWYLYNTTKVINGTTVYYYSDENLTTPLANGYNIVKPEKTGYTFAGYYTDVNGGGTQYVDSNGTFINSIYKNKAQNTTLYAKWNPNTYTITYDYNGVRNYADIYSNPVTFSSFTGATNTCAYIGTVTNDGFEATDEITVSYDMSYTNLTTVSGQDAYMYGQGSGDVTTWYPGFGWGNGHFPKGTGSTSYSYAVTMNAEKITNNYFTLSHRSDYYSSGSVSFSNLKAVKTTKKSYNKSYGDTLGSMPTPVETGYTFSGWYTERTGGAKVLSSTSVPAANTTYYAHYTPKTNTSYTVNHYTHDYGAQTYTLNSTETKTGTSDSTVTLANLKKTISGFTYENGFTRGDTTKPESKYAMTTTTILADGSRVINLYYRPNYLYIQYDMNGGTLNTTGNYGTSGSLVTTSSTGTSTNHLRGFYGSKVGAVNKNTYETATSSGLHNYNSTSDINIEKTGYIGKSGAEWNTKADGTGTSYNHLTTTYDANGFGGADLSTGDKTVKIYVNWIPKKLHIVYNKNDGTGATTTETFTYDGNMDDNSFNPPSSYNTRTGYTFKGWSLKADGSDNIRWSFNSHVGQTWFLNQVGANAEKTLNVYAIWEPVKYKATLDNQSATTAGTTAVWYKFNTTTNINGVTVYYFSDESLSTPLSNGYNIVKPTKTGYTFGGYYTGTNGSGTQYVNADGMFVNNLYKSVANNSTLYAKWVANQYTVSLDANYGTIPTTTGWNIQLNGDNFHNATKSIAYGGTYGTLPTPTRTGMDFKGWYSSMAVGNYTITASTSNWNYKAIKYNLQPGATYKITMDSATVTAGSATQFTTYVYDFTTSSILTEKLTNFGNNINYDIAVPANADISHKLQIIIYAGKGGSTANVGASYTNVKVGTMGNTTETEIKSSTTMSMTRTHQLHAKWAIKQHTLTINPNGGSWNNSTSNTTITQNYNTTYSIPNNPTKAGYVFNGWTHSGTGTFTNYDTSSTATTSTTINYNSSSSAKPTAYNNSGGGTVTNSMVSDSSATGGYSLKVVTNGAASPGAGGIYTSIFPTDLNRINVLEVKAKIPSGYTIYLGGTGNVYTGMGSTYKISDATGNGAWKTYTFVIYTGKTGTISPTAYLYVSGSNNQSVTWYINSLVMKSYTPAQFKSKFTFTGNSTLTASWAVGGARISFSTNNGTFNTTYVKSWKNGYYSADSTSAWRFYTYNTAYNTYPGDANYDWTPDSRVTSRTGYTFDGWTTSANGGTKLFNANGTLISSVSGYSDSSGKWIKYDANVNVYAKWNPNSYTIAFNANGGSGSMSNLAMTYGTAKALTSNAFTRAGYNFSGWNTKADGTGTAYSNGQSVSNLATSGTITLYAQWTAKPVRVYYNSNGGSFGGNTTYKAYGSTNWVSTDGSTYFYQSINGGASTDLYNVSTFGITRTGYSPTASKQWCTNSSGSGTCYNMDSSYTYAQYVAASSEKTTYYELNVYVNWAGNSYTIAFNANGGSGSMSNLAMTYGTAKTLTSNAFTRAGYNFSGWNTKSDGSGTAYSNEQSVNNLATSGTVTLYAQWTAKPVRIYFNSNGGSFGGNTTYKAYGSTNWVSKDGSTYFYQTVNGGASTDLYNVSTFGITRSGYFPSTGKEWCTNSSGGGSCFNMDSNYTYAQYVAASSEKTSYYELDLYVNWLYAYWQNVDTGKLYSSNITTAISGASAGNTLKLLANYTDNTQGTQIGSTSSYYINVNKGINFDLNGKTLTMGKAHLAFTSGTSYIYGSSGTITSALSTTMVVGSGGTLYVGTKTKSDGYNITIQNTASCGDGIVSKGGTLIIGGTGTSTGPNIVGSCYGILAAISGNWGGSSSARTITSYYSKIRTTATSSSSVAGISITDTSYKTTLDLQGAYVYGYGMGIQSNGNSSSSISISNGYPGAARIESKNSYAIHHSSGSMTIGVGTSTGTGETEAQVAAYSTSASTIYQTGGTIYYQTNAGSYGKGANGSVFPIYLAGGTMYLQGGVIRSLQSSSSFKRTDGTLQITGSRGQASGSGSYSSWNGQGTLSTTYYNYRKS